MRKLSVFMVLISIFAFVSCEKSELIIEDQQELVTKSAKKVLNFRTHLSGENEVPSVETMADGQAIFQLSKDGTELSYKLIVDNIENVRMAHIHMAPAGSNGGVVAWLYGPELIEGVFEGVLSEGVITDSDLVGALTGMTIMDLVHEISEGNTYVNVHTVQNPGGEIRGQIMGNMPQPNKFYSKTVSVGNGVARAWIKTLENGDPLEVGIDLTGKALMNLPDEPMQYVLPLPKNKGNYFYNHVLFDWNPAGHEPPGIYDIPHFDFHFYITSSEYREAIPPMNPPYFDPAPDDMYVPTNYMELPGLVPGMGAHWVDSTSAELPPILETFTKTFIWGSYDGEFIFWEPMITRDYLLTHPDEIIAIPQPEAYQKDGWYAMDYKITYSMNPEKYTIALVNMVYKEAE